MTEFIEQLKNVVTDVRVQRRFQSSKDDAVSVHKSRKDLVEGSCPTSPVQGSIDQAVKETAVADTDDQKRHEVAEHVHVRPSTVTRRTIKLLRGCIAAIAGNRESVVWCGTPLQVCAPKVAELPARASSGGPDQEVRWLDVLVCRADAM
jgi:hypothetical protein